MSNKKRIEELEATCSALQGSLHRLEHLCRLYREGPQRLTVSDPPVSQDHPSYSDYIWSRDNAEKLQALWRTREEVSIEIENLTSRHLDHLRGYNDLASETRVCIDRMGDYTVQATHLQAEFDELAKVIREGVKFGPMLGDVQLRLAGLEGRIRELKLCQQEDRTKLTALDTLIKAPPDEAELSERVKKLERAVESAVAFKPLSEDKLVGKTTDSPRPLIDGDLSKGILSVWKVKLNNTADPSATLYWRRAAGGILHLCELGPRPGNVTAVETEWAHPCCPADDFPDPGRAKKEQPKAYCGDCLERCLRLLCEGYPNET